MDESCYHLMEKLVPATYIRQATEARTSKRTQIRLLLEQRKWPVNGWDDAAIELFLQEISQMDSNNFPANVGVGERESRVHSALVRKRHFGFGHGVGRSGDVTAVQPKAAGSSLLVQLTNQLLLDVMRTMGVRSTASCVLLPVATGMSLVLTMLTLRATKPAAKYVLWPRIDQKSCFKSMVTAGFIPVVIENRLEGDELRTDMEELGRQIEHLGADNIVCVMSTTSCFAPRTPDRLVEIAKRCKTSGVAHIINNAYGVQAARCMNLIEEAQRCGRVDAFIQSTDKNFLVPVGGAVVAGFDKNFIEEIAKTYPGRASAAPMLDVFITLLSLGSTGYKKLVADRKVVMKQLSTGLEKIAAEHGERLLKTPHNPISLAISLPRVVCSSGQASNSSAMTELGSMLFKRSVSGTRVIAPGSSKEIGPHTFSNWGAHHDHLPFAYMTAAAAIGMTTDEVSSFLSRLDKTLTKWKKKFETVPSGVSPCVAVDVADTAVLSAAPSSQATVSTDVQTVSVSDSDTCTNGGAAAVSSTTTCSNHPDEHTGATSVVEHADTA
ncbi:O-phosphoseryl-tRNA(Sec) selenium transferase-like [Sycon ciliatum]|uniref:O-phosphoseryl-tRNA(Sec) selenium transferase-like n=1 Tax=Sycon ciliatum TaxID=27933 RepID=UPI0020A9E4A2|eukprot:scpid67325/ scgid33731/ O-phosphoseryl-tRNA(Sec) selenium transferase; Selenocysteine synthase; Selenocysteinyl-tRNA(Sec) synthase; Sep-tRNA:Sec-tRNA synthase; Soluble liver antigen/liver pancreas antigen-like; UGA suppressor tRNA-associated protein homolog